MRRGGRTVFSHITPYHGQLWSQCIATLPLVHSLPTLPPQPSRQMSPHKQCECSCSGDHPPWPCWLSTWQLNGTDSPVSSNPMGMLQPGFPL